MSYTQLFKFKKDGNAECFAEVKNAWRGAMAVWDILDKKYLPPFIPEWTKVLREIDLNGYSRAADRTAIKEIWGLYKKDEISETDRIVLGSTFDNVIVMKEDLPKLIEAFRDFDGESSLKEQADIFELALKDDDLIAVAWNQTSINSDAWESDVLGEDEDGEEIYLPYNILTMDKHWNLFETTFA